MNASNNDYWIEEIEHSIRLATTLGAAAAAPGVKWSELLRSS